MATIIAAAVTGLGGGGNGRDGVTPNSSKVGPVTVCP